MQQNNNYYYFLQKALHIFKLQAGMIGKMIYNHDCDYKFQDFYKVIVSDHKSQYGKMIASRSQKM